MTTAGFRDSSSLASNLPFGSMKAPFSHRNERWHTFPACHSIHAAPPLLPQTAQDLAIHIYLIFSHTTTQTIYLTCLHGLSIIHPAIPLTLKPSIPGQAKCISTQHMIWYKPHTQNASEMHKAHPTPHFITLMSLMLP
jgi:hypothetical protein